MLESLAEKFEEAVKSIRGQNKLSEANIAGALKTVRKALLDADVNIKVVEELLSEIKSKAVGEQVVKGIRPDQKLVEIIHKELIDILGGETLDIVRNEGTPTIVMLVGLQGAGKTTAAAKLGLYLKEKGLKVLLVAGDTFRPAAREQLKTLGGQTEIDVYTDDKSSLEIVENAIKKGKEERYDVIIIDTAGRQYIDKELMSEIRTLREMSNPDEVLLVVDSMIGQEAAELTKSFDEALSITGAILTKMDGDSRGGAALSIKKVSGKAIRFVGTGEKVEALERFYPDRMASRILGMGDILTLVDKAQKEVEIEDVANMQKKFEEASFDFNDFLKQMKLIKRMGSIGGLLKLMPGVGRIDDSMLKTGEDRLHIIETMINSMTQEERRVPMLLNRDQKRRRRIAKGSGRTIGEVDKMISNFEKMKVMMQGLARGGMSGMPRLGDIRERDFSNKSRSRGINNERKRENSNKKKKGFFEL